LEVGNWELTVICPTHLVPDAPADKDAFGAHQRIADAIAQLVETRGGQCIGLLGTWGSGKSTVVHLLQNQLQQRDSCLVWVFDAWAHEGDSLRRTFLESVIERLTEKGWLEERGWKERLEYLAGRRKVTEQASRPHLSPLAIVLAISLLFVPIGGSMFESRLDAGVSFGFTASQDWAALGALLLAFAPLVVLALYVGGLLLVQRRSTQQVRESLRDALTVFVRQTDTAQRTETLDSGEPTTLEFERTFVDVMSAALPPAGKDADTSRRLVVVIDNLDRVNTEQALAVWSTLQTFVRHRDTREPWLSGLWCVLPFDADAIRRLWPRDGKQGVDVAESFLDKTFQIRFEVPLPLLSDWKDYIMARLKEAMPQHTDDDFFRIYRLYAVRREQGVPAPTPRELKLFVNQVGSLHRQWQDDIPLPDLAYYALLQRDKVPITSETITQFPLPSEVGLVSDDVRAHLAAMAYGVPIDSARELLLREPIIQALEAADGGELEKLSKGDDAFALVFEQALWRGCEEWPQAEAGKLLHAVLAIDKSQIGRDVPPWRLKQWFDHLESAVRRAGTWAPMDGNAVDGILALSERRPVLAPALFAAFITTRTTTAPWGRAAAMPAFVSDYLRLESGLRAWVTDFGVDIPGDSGAFGSLAFELVQQDRAGRVWANFRPASMETLANELSEPTRPFGPESLAAVRIATSSQPSVDWTPFAASAVERVRSAEGRQSRFVLGALHLLWDKGGSTVAGRLLDDAWSWLANSWLTEPHEFDAPLFLTIARADPTLKWLHTEGDHPFRSELYRRLNIVPDDALQHLVQTMYEIGKAEIMLTLAERRPEMSSLAYAVLLELAKLGPSTQVCPPLLLIEKWDSSFRWLDPYEIVTLLARNNPDFAQASADMPFTWSSSGAYSSIYAGVLDGRDGPVPDTLIASCVGAVQSVSSSMWVSSLNGDGRLVRLWLALNRRGHPVNIVQIAAAFATLAPKLADLSNDAAPWRKAAFEALPPEARDPIVSTILETVFKNPQPNLHRAFDLIGTSVFQSSWLIAHPDAFAVAACFVIDDLNDFWLADLARAAAVHARALSQADAQRRRELATSFEARKSSARTSGAEAAIQELGPALLLAGVLSSGEGDVASA
jgi:hypothetical protein